MVRPIGSGKKRSAQNLPEAVGAELTELRIQRAWSQLQFAEMLGYDVTYIGDIERGQKSPTLRTLLDFANRLDIPLSVIIRAAEKRLPKRSKRTNMQIKTHMPDPPADLLIALQRAELHYSSKPQAVYYCIPIHPDGYCGVFGDGENGCYEWFIWTASKLRYSDSAYGEPEVALRDVLKDVFE